jgi:hypothetical protein
VLEVEEGGQQAFGPIRLVTLSIFIVKQVNMKIYELSMETSRQTKYVIIFKDNAMDSQLSTIEILGLGFWDRIPDWSRLNEKLL